MTDAQFNDLMNKLASIEKALKAKSKPARITVHERHGGNLDQEPTFTEVSIRVQDIKKFESITWDHMNDDPVYHTFLTMVKAEYSLHVRETMAEIRELLEAA